MTDIVLEALLVNQTALFSTVQNSLQNYLEGTVVQSVTSYRRPEWASVVIFPERYAVFTLSRVIPIEDL